MREGICEPAWSQFTGSIAPTRNVHTSAPNPANPAVMKNGQKNRAGPIEPITGESRGQRSTEVSYEVLKAGPWSHHLRPCEGLWGREKCRQQCAHLCIGDPEFALQQGRCNGEIAAVDIVDQNGQAQQKHYPIHGSRV